MIGEHILFVDDEVPIRETLSLFFKMKGIAVTAVGTDPGNISITPDDSYALVLNQGSGDMAVLRIVNITRAVSDYRRSRKGPIFRMIPVGSKPVSAAILPI